MSNSGFTPTMDARTRAAWQAQLAAASKISGLLPDLVRYRHELLPRFATLYAQLRALPRHVRRILQRRWKQSLAGLALWLALGQSPALAATINVNATGTLIDAITAANTDTATVGCPAGSGADKIILPATSMQTLTSVNNDTYGPTGLPVISSKITIEGQGSTIVREVSAPEFRIFTVSSEGDLTLNETAVSEGSIGDEGGDIANMGGTLTLTTSRISDNYAEIGGGGVFNGGILTMMNSTIAGNGAYEGGGGVDNRGTMTVIDSTILGNGTGEGGGGGVFNDGTLTVKNSTISDNGTFHHGGGVGNLNGTVTITNSTISGNEACYEGIGHGVANYSGTVIVTNSTITGNRLISGGCVDFPPGGEAVYNGDGILILARTLVSGNAVAEIRNVSGAVHADNYNLFGVNGTAGVEGFSPGPTDIVPAPGVQLADILDPTLADNGGPTLTHNLVPGSPAIGAIPAANPDCGGTDQRGVPRPQGAGCDIGAVEFTTEGVPRTVTIDIRPGLPGNRLPLSSPEFSKPVAILSTETFDALTVDPATVRFGVTGTEAAPRHVGRDDVNSDGRPDLIVRFRLGDTGIECGDTEAFLTGETFDGQLIEGSDAIHTVQCP